MTNAKVQAALTFDNETVRGIGHGLSVVIPAGTSVTAIASLLGDVPKTAADLPIASVLLQVGGGVKLQVRGLGESWPLINLTTATLTPGGHVAAGYRIIHEDMATVLRIHLAKTAIAADPSVAGKIPGELTVHDQAAHAMLDEMVRQHVEPALQDAIRANASATAIPGVNLAEVLGI